MYIRLVTMYKNNSQDSSKFKDCSPLQLSCNLTGRSSHLATILILSVKAHSAKADLCCYVLRTLTPQVDVL